MSPTCVFVWLMGVAAVAAAATSEAAPEVSSSELMKRSLSRDCARSYGATCLKLDLVSWVERLSEQDTVSLVPGVSVVREAPAAGARSASTADLVAELARDFPNDAEARLDAFLLKKISGYLGSHSLRFSLFSTEAEGARKKDKGGLGAALAALLMMKGTLGALGFGALAALAGKALMTGLMALMLSAIVGLKSLAGGGHKQTTYEIVSKPIYSHAHTQSASHEEVGHHGHYGGYGRSMQELPPIPLSIQNVSP